MRMSRVVRRTREVLGFGIQKAKQKPERRELEAGRQVDDLAKVGPASRCDSAQWRCHRVSWGMEAPQPKNPSWHECMNLDWNA